MAKRASFEILGTHFWDFDPSIFGNYRKMVENSFALNTEWERGGNNIGIPYLSRLADGFQDKLYAGNAGKAIEWDSGWMNELEDDDQLINIIPVDGPILRNGDACSYGSQNYRDWMLAASEIPQCVGHIFYINTPGGSAYSKNDFQYAIDIVRSKGQPIIALVDGLCASAGMALAAMCDQIYFVNPMDRIGCIGTMCAFYATPNGAIDTRTQERYVEVYGTKSPYKNKEFRDASVGNEKELQYEVDELNEQFQTLVSTYRPSVKPDQLEGRIYNAGDVVGTLTDGQNTLQGCIDVVLQMAGVPKRVGKENTSSGAPSKGNNEQKTNENTHSKNKLTMKEYPKIMSALGLNGLGVGKDESIYLHKDLAEALENTLMQAEQNQTSLEAKVHEVTRLNARIEELKQANEKALADFSASHKKEVDKLNQSHEEALTALNDEHATVLSAEKSAHEDALNAANAATEAANKELESAKEELAAKECELKELSEVATQSPKPAEAPKFNVVGATQKEPELATKAVYQEGMSPEEAAKAYKEREAKLAKRFR